MRLDVLVNFFWMLQMSAQTDQSETEEELAQKTFTLKQLIRKIHITEPVEHVMCLIGKRYMTPLALRSVEVRGCIGFLFDISCRVLLKLLQNRKCSFFLNSYM